jgi:hypothetical protein
MVALGEGVGALNFDWALISAAVNQPASLNVLRICSSVPTSSRLVMSDGFGGFSAIVWNGSAAISFSSAAMSATGCNFGASGAVRSAGSVRRSIISTPGSYSTPLSAALKTAPLMPPSTPARPE